MAEERKFLGWEIKFEIDNTDEKFTLEIMKMSLGFDNGSSIPAASITYNVDSSKLKIFLKHHTGTLTIINKSIVTDQTSEIFKIKLQSVSQSGVELMRETGIKSRVPITIGVKYMCISSSPLLSRRVGGMYNNKKIEEVIKSLYSDTKCPITLQLDKLDNQTKYEQIFIPESNFIDSCRILTQNYGLYKDLFLMFGDTFVSDNPPKWIMTSSNKIKSETINVHFIPHEQDFKSMEQVSTKNYYVFYPINTNNSFAHLQNRIPKKFKCISLDDDKFFNETVVDTVSTIKNLKFLKNVDQFEKQLSIEEEMVWMNRKDMFDFSFNDLITRFGTNGVKPTILDIGTPFLMKHWKIGNIVNYIPQHESYSSTNIQFIVLGVLYKFEQAGGGQGGSIWRSTLQARLSTSSILDLT